MTERPYIRESVPGIVEYLKHTTPYISIQPGMCGGEPTICGYRMPVEQVAGQWAGGAWSVADMHDSWSELDHDSIVVCCWYMARYGGRKWKKPWKLWLEKYDGRLWKGEERIPLPPRFLMGETGEEAAPDEVPYEDVVAAIRAETIAGWEIDSRGSE